MRVCEVTPYSLARVSGISTVVVDLARELERRGNRVAVVAPRPELPHSSTSFEQWSVGLHGSFRTVRFSFAVARILTIRRNQWDLLHVHQAHLASLFATIVSHILGKPAIATFHSVPLATKSLGGFLEKMAQRLVPSLCAGTSFVSEHTRLEFGVKGQVIHNGVDLGRFSRAHGQRASLRRSIGLNGFVVAFSGRRTRSKGYFDLLKAIHLARRAGADVRLMTMGDISPTEAAEVEGLVRELGLIGSLVDLGHRKDSDLILEAADAFALPSYHEGLPLGILEALATPLPVVASNVGGIPEVIEDGKQGLLFRPGDVEGLAERLLRLARDPALSKALAENARERVKDFSLARTVDAYARMYENASRNSIRSSRTRRAGGSR